MLSNFNDVLNRVCQSLATIVYEFLNQIEGVFYDVERIGVTYADVVFSAFAECTAGDDRNVFGIEKGIRKLFAVHIGGFYARKDVKRAARLETFKLHC